MIQNKGSRLRLLVVEDHEALREVTMEILEAAGYQVVGAASAEALGEMARDFHFDIAILDLNLPGEDGLSLATRLRRICPGIGVIMVTVRNALADRLSGYEMGADLYLSKPTEPAELCAAVHSLGRRLASSNQAPMAKAFILQQASRTLLAPAGAVKLREAEFQLLKAFALAQGQFVDNWQLLNLLEKGMDACGKTQLEVLISRLRSKLVAHGCLGNPLQSVRGRGYRLGIELKMD
jgi:DNA-binding response OmpR family regulator